MSPLVAYHATNRFYRDSIRQRGLIGAQPNPSRPFGVYVYCMNGELDHPIRVRGNRIEWTHSRGSDVWRVAYIGPLTPDAYVTNGMVCLFDPEHVTLVIGNGSSH